MSCKFGFLNGSNQLVILGFKLLDLLIVVVTHHGREAFIHGVATLIFDRATFIIDRETLVLDTLVLDRATFILTGVSLFLDWATALSLCLTIGLKSSRESERLFDLVLSLLEKEIGELANDL